MLISEEVPIAESALLVVDAQDGFMVDADWGRRDNLLFEENVARLVDAHRAANLPVVFFMHTDEDEPFSAGSPHFKLMDFIQPAASEPVFIKTTRNCFTSTPLSTFLLERRVRRLAITGIQMEQCCETTARLAADLGFAVDFVIDATITFPITNTDRPGEELGVEAIRERTEYALRDRFARIINTRELIDELMVPA